LINKSIENFDGKIRTSSQNIGRFNSYKENYTKIDSNIEIIETNVNVDQNFGNKSDKIRNTMSAQPQNYFQSRENLSSRKDDEVQYTKSNPPSYMPEPQPQPIRSSLNESKLK
jgi:hypothetical protein